jgi:GGDEF domain-containing protein
MRAFERLKGLAKAPHTPSAAAAVGACVAAGGWLASAEAIAVGGMAAGWGLALILQAMALRRSAGQLAERDAALVHALAQDGFRDPDTGLGSPALLRVEWARQLARYQRHGEVFSLALLDIEEQGRSQLRASVLRAVAATMLATTRREDSLYRLGPARIGALLTTADYAGAMAFIERATEWCACVDRDDQAVPIGITGQVVGISEGMEPAVLIERTGDQLGESWRRRLMARFAGQRAPRAGQRAA